METSAMAARLRGLHCAHKVAVKMKRDPDRQLISAGVRTSLRCPRIDVYTWRGGTVLMTPQEECACGNQPDLHTAPGQDTITLNNPDMSTLKL